MKLKLSIALNVVLLAVVAAFLIRDQIRLHAHQLVSWREIPASPQVFAAPRHLPLPPARFEYRLELPRASAGILAGES